MKLEQSL